MERIRINVTHIIAGGAGILAGGVGGFLLAHRRAEKKANWRIASEVEAVKEHYRQAAISAAAAAANAAGKGDHPDIRQTTVGDPGEERKTSIAELANRYRGIFDPTLPPPGGAGSPAPDLRGFVQDQVGPDATGREDPLAGLPGRDPDAEETDAADASDHDDGEDGIDTDPPPSSTDTGSGPRIRVITIEEYENDKPEYRKVDITYYDQDSMLVDDREEPIADFVSVVGRDFASHFGENDDPDIIYVRNNRLETDFEIIRKRGAYGDEVLTYGEQT